MEETQFSYDGKVNHTTQLIQIVSAVNHSSLITIMSDMGFEIPTNMKQEFENDVLSLKFNWFFIRKSDIHRKVLDQPKFSTAAPSLLVKNRRFPISLR